MVPEIGMRDRRLVIPARTISGSTEHMLGELDEMIVALQCVRALVDARVSRPTRQSRPRWLVRVWRAIRGRQAVLEAVPARRQA